MPSDLRWLLIETSGATGRVGLACGDTVRAAREMDRARRHARDLAPLVQSLLQEQAWPPTEIGGVIVSLGPGSYTGLRVGLMSAKALAFALGCPLVGVPTFEVLAWQARQSGASVEVVEDAQQNRLYVQRFGFSPDGVPEPQSTLHIREAAEWLQQLPTCALTGPGLRKHRPKLPPTAAVTPEATWEPQLEGLLRLGLARWQRGQTDSPLTLEPLYLRPSSAEEQWTALGR
jgi:tRNA threonylcarbamoyladenosine biosynthesis protein TsaB